MGFWTRKTVNFSGFQRSKRHFSEVKNRLLKTALFVKNAYLNPITFYRNAVFAVFDENDHFSTTFRTPLVLVVFQCFLQFSRCQVFPRDFGKSRKFSNISKKTLKNPFLVNFSQNVTDKPDTRKCNILVEIS